MTMTTIIEDNRKNAITSVKLGSRKQVLSELAKHQKRSVHSLMIEAVDMYIEQKQARIAFEQEAICSYEHYKATGLHTTLEEMQQWAKSLNTPNPQPLPQCHK
jgi:predicted transcriptional regulator